MIDITTIDSRGRKLQMRDKYGLDTKVLQFMPDMNFFPEKFNKLVCDEIYRWTLVLKKISNSHFVCRPVQIKVV